MILKGDVPSPVNPPEGCRFHTRCWLYERLGQPEECRTIEPPLAVLDGEHQCACHFASEALKTNVGIAHIDDRHVRHGTPAKALESLAAAGIPDGGAGGTLDAPAGSLEGIISSLGGHLPSSGAPVPDMGAPGASLGAPGGDSAAPNVDPEAPAPGTRPS